MNMMSEETIHITDIIRSPFHKKWGLYPGRVYYYQGNFYYPLNIPKEVKSKVSNQIKMAIKGFMKKNSELVNRDRENPCYKSKFELYSEQHDEWFLEKDVKTT